MRRSALAAAAVALLLAACGGEPAASPTAEATPTPEPTAMATATPRPTETEGAALPSGDVLPSFPGFDFDGDPELAATLPETVGGLTLNVISMRGDQFMSGAGAADPSMQAFLDSVGADLEDVSVAVAGGGDAETFITVSAFRVVGADEETLADQFLGASETNSGITGWEEASVGGKSVFTAQDPTGQTEGTFYVYATGDTIYMVITTAPELAEEALAGLP